MTTAERRTENWELGRSKSRGKRLARSGTERSKPAPGVAILCRGKDWSHEEMSAAL